MLDCVEKARISDDFVGPLVLEDYIQKLQQDNEVLRRTITQKNRVIAQKDRWIEIVTTSTAYRVGRFITWVPRKCKRFVQCSKDHGFVYAVKHGAKKVGRPVLKITGKIPNGIQCVKDHGLTYTIGHFFRKLKK